MDSAHSNRSSINVLRLQGLNVQSGDTLEYRVKIKYSDLKTLGLSPSKSGLLKIGYDLRNSNSQLPSTAFDSGGESVEDPLVDSAGRTSFDYVVKLVANRDDNMTAITPNISGLTVDSTLNVNVVNVIDISKKVVRMKKSSNQHAELSLKPQAPPNSFALSQNYPNPFNPDTRLDYQLKDDGYARLTIYDILGREVAVLMNEPLQAGYYTAHWNASNASSGVYVYRLTVNGIDGKTVFNQSKKMILMK
jgi:hypothetical protein